MDLEKEEDIKSDIDCGIEIKNKKELKRVKNNVRMTTFIITSIFYIGVLLFLLSFVNDIMDEDTKKLSNVLDLYESMYVGDVEKSDLVDMAIQGMVVASNDKYGGYVPAIQKNTVTDKINTGKYKGFGFTYDVQEGYIEIKDIVEDSSAGRSSLKIGDKITHINNEPLTEEVLEKFILSVSTGDINSVIFTLENSKQLELEQGIVNMPKISYNIENNIGFINIYTFVDDTIELFKEGIDFVLDEDVEKIVFDLRGNSGGSLDAVLEMLDYITKDVLIAKVDYQTGESVEYFSDSYTVFNEKQQIEILVDNYTTSASELFTMCLQDVYNAKVIGKKTYGKSTVLSTFMFKDGSMLAMSTGVYCSLNGRYIEDNGIEPDVLLNEIDINKNATELYELGILN